MSGTGWVTVNGSDAVGILCADDKPPPNYAGGISSATLTLTPVASVSP